MISTMFNHTFLDAKNEEQTKHKYLFRLTFKIYISCICKMAPIIENDYYPMSKEELDGIIDVDFGDKTDDCLNIDKSVYRAKGVGKMRAPNAYQGKINCFRNNH